MRPFLYFLLTLTFSLSGQALIKTAVTQALKGSRPTLAEFVLHHLPALVLSPTLLGGLVLSGIGLVAWMFVLSQYDLSRALPILGGLGYIILFLVGRFILRERTGWVNFLGILLVTAGLYCLTLKTPR